MEIQLPKESNALTKYIITLVVRTRLVKKVKNQFLKHSDAREFEGDREPNARAFPAP